MTVEAALVTSRLLRTSGTRALELRDSSDEAGVGETLRPRFSRIGRDGGMLAPPSSLVEALVRGTEEKVVFLSPLLGLLGASLEKKNLTLKLLVLLMIAL